MSFPSVALHALKGMNCTVYNQKDHESRVCVKHYIRLLAFISTGGLPSVFSTSI